MLSLKNSNYKRRLDGKDPRYVSERERQGASGVALSTARRNQSRRNISDPQNEGHTNKQNHAIPGNAPRSYLCTASQETQEEQSRPIGRPVVFIEHFFKPKTSFRWFLV